MVVEEDKKISSCYIHIPFCKSICSYCDFCKNFYNEDIVFNYLKSLDEEINNDYNGEEINTLYIGGGTPSCLSFNALKKLFQTLKKIKLSKNYEFTFECNYDDINEDLLKMLKKFGVNRISIGVQSFNEKYEKILNRKINRKEMINSINLSKKYFCNINIDLMYALPDEDLKELEEELKTFISLDVKHISTYALIIEEHTKLGINNVDEVNEDIQNKMYYMILDRLKSNGYNHYEISNFSKPGFESKHNLVYWNNEEYYGFGAGASGFVNKKRYDNTKSIFNYIKGKRKIYEEQIDDYLMIKDEVMLNLRKIKGINKSSFFSKYNIEFEEAFDYLPLVEYGFLKEDDENIFIPENKLFISNEIIIKLLDKFNEITIKSSDKFNKI